MTFYLEKLGRDEFWRHNLVFFAGSMVVAVLNYIYYPVLGRLLSIRDFGEVQTLVSIFLQSTILFNVMGLVTVNVVANRGKKKVKDHIIFELEKLSLIASAVALVTTIILARQLQSFFHFSSFWPFILLSLALMTSVPLTFRQFYLRGRLRFGSSAWSAIWAAGAKLVLSALLVYLGFRSGGAILGIMLAQLVALIYTADRARKAGFLRSENAHKSRWLDLKAIKPELVYGLLVLLVTLIITLQFSLDIIVVKHYFNADIAGLYAGITTIARIIYFVTGSIGIVLMSSVKLDDQLHQNRAILGRSFGLLLALGLPALLLFSLAPDLIIKILLGSKYLAYSSLLPRLGLVMFIISAVGLLLNYYLALRRYGVAIPAVLGAIITYVFILLRHASLVAVINGLFWGSICMLAMVGVWGLINRRMVQAEVPHA